MLRCMTTAYNHALSADLKAFLQTQAEALKSFQEERLRQYMLELTWTFLYTTRYESEEVDQGWDCSWHSRNTHRAYRLEDYQTLGDFLAEPTAETRATFVSGAGLDVVSLEDWLRDELDRDFYDFLHPQLLRYLGLNAEDDDLPSEAQDEEMLCILDWIETSLKQLKEVHFRWMVEAHRAAAEREQAKLQQEAQELRVQAEAEARVAERVHRQGRFLLSQSKYHLADFAVLMAALEGLAQVVAPEELRIYLHSQIFASITSNAVATKAQMHFLSEVGSEDGQT